MFKAKEIAIESVASFLLGGLPAIVTYCYGGGEALKEFSKDALPSGFPVWYVFALSGIALVILALKRYGSKSAIPNGVLWESLQEIHDELKGVYRFAAGFLITFVVVWVLTDWSSIHAGALMLLVYGLLGLLICLFYRMASSYIEGG